MTVHYWLRGVGVLETRPTFLRSASEPVAMALASSDVLKAIANEIHVEYGANVGYWRLDGATEIPRARV